MSIITDETVAAIQHKLPLCRIDNSIIVIDGRKVTVVYLEDVKMKRINNMRMYKSDGYAIFIDQRGVAVKNVSGRVVDHIAVGRDERTI